jgi:hypothetical protein
MPEPSSALEGVFADRWEPLGDGLAPWSGWAERSDRPTVDPRLERRAA